LSLLTTSKVDIGGKLTAGIVHIGGKFAPGVKLWNGVTTVSLLCLASTQFDIQHFLKKVIEF
jgi:hypothetical protein